MGRTLLTLGRQSLMRAGVGSEPALRCLRALARAGEPVDVSRLQPYLENVGRYARVALVALADLSSHGNPEALPVLTSALRGKDAADAAFLLSRLQTPEAMAVLDGVLFDTNEVGLHAAAGLLAFSASGAALRQLTERLCDSEGSAPAARALLAASPTGEWLTKVDTELTTRAADGDIPAERGRGVAAALLTACGLRADMKAALRAMGSSDDRLVLVGAQAAYWLGEAERARAVILDLHRRGPQIAGQAFEVLTRWADIGDEGALALHRRLVEQRPIDLSRSALFEAIASSTRPVLLGTLTRALGARDPLMALEAARAVARLRDPPFPVPALAL
jgi:hypothetical protein